MSEKINIAIIGGGIIGCCVAHELAKDKGDIYVFEKNPGITKGENQSSRNSGVLHAGIYYEPEIRPLKGRLCIEGNRLWLADASGHETRWDRMVASLVAPVSWATLKATHQP